MDMIVQTRTVFARIPRKLPAARTKLIQLSDQLYRILDCRRACIRPKILGFILFHLTRKKDPGVSFPQRHFYIRISLVIFQQNIVFRAMLFDQIAFQHKCFQLGVRNNIFKTVNQRDHLVFADPFSVAGTKILTHAVFQIHCLSDINNRIVPIVHQVDSRTIREFF